MLKLNKNYYIALDLSNKLIGRFVNLQDAIDIVPIGYNCFGPNYKLGNVYHIGEDNIDLFKPNKAVVVFESIEEYKQYNEQEEFIL